MPTVIALKQDQTDKKVKDLYFLIKEEEFPVEAVQLIQNQIKDFINEAKSWSREDLIAIAENIIEEYNGTLIPFKLYLVSY
jgi:hypothetical protein